jgi:hypothetical protein
MIKMFLLALLVLLPASISFADDDLQSNVPSNSASDEPGFEDIDEEMMSQGVGENYYEDLQRRPPRRQPPRRRPPPRRYEPWVFLGCTNTQFNCSWAATRWGFRDYRTVWDIRCNRAFYACYGRNRWSN